MAVDALASAPRRLALHLASGATFEAQLRLPETAAGRVPAIVLLGGLRRGAGALDLIPRTTEPVALAGFDYPLELPRKVRWREILPLARDIESGIAQTREALGVLHRELADHPRVDPQRITIVGVSLGSPFAVMAAADHGYPGLVIVHGFGDVPHTIRHQFARRWEPRYGVFGTALAYLAQKLIGLLVDLPDIERHAERLGPQQRVFMLTARDDDFIPPRASQSLLAALQRSSAQLTLAAMPGRHVRGRGDAEAIERMFRQSTDWMRREGLL